MSIAPRAFDQMEKTQIKIRNYKCFGAEPQGFSRILPFNIIIGKNNSGKSSLIELIANLIPVNESFFKTRSDRPREIVIADLITEEAIKNVYPRNVRGGGVPQNYKSNYDYGLTLLGTQINYSTADGRRKMLISLHPEPEFAKKLAPGLVEHISFPFTGKTFKRISSERDMDLEREEFPPKLKTKGAGATNLIQQFINSTELDRKAVEEDFLGHLNEILNPEIFFNRILVQKDGQGLWEIYFEDRFKQRIPLSAMGSGIKTILLVLINLHLIPVLEKKNPSDYVFAFEELENNLHPSIQRKLFTYLRDYAERQKSIFFLTTHSNVVIDLFANDDKSQILHVVNNGQLSIVSDVINYSHSKHILEDLDIRASDLLQSNGIVWVEGPSDRIYLSRWLSLLAPELNEGVHFLIMFYGGRLLSRLHFRPSFFEQELIPLLSINRNAFVIIDRDAKTVSDELNQTKLRIQKEIGENSCWVTEGREIENYIPKNVIENWLENKHSSSIKFTPNKYQKIETALSKVSEISYETDKVKYANEICEFFSKPDLQSFDLSLKLQDLIESIKKWNRI